jgi:KDO2-lipid IV(A) lauroyltransferase
MLNLLTDTFVYYLIRLFLFPFQYIPLSWIRIFGKWTGTLIFYLVPSYRKKALSNLGLAKDLKYSQKDFTKIAKESLQNVAILSLEFAKFSKAKNLSSHVVCKNPNVAQTLHDQGTGIIFFCGHLSNWETLFLDGTSRMKGIAIGKPIKNKRLYRWIVSIREKFGGKIIAQKDAVKEGLKALRKGVFVGIVGDQGMPTSGYLFPFLGRKAWTSTAPALLAYRASCPIIVATPQRTKKGYEISYSDPIWPNLNQPIGEEVVRMMDLCLESFQEKIKQNPSEWLWQHNRWKQQTPKNVYKRFRHDSISIVLPHDLNELEKILPHLHVFKDIYPLDFLHVQVPKSFTQSLPILVDEIHFYTDLKETLLLDPRFKLVFDFADYPPLKKHFQNLSAFEVLNLQDLKKLAAPYLQASLSEDLPSILKRALCRPGSLWSDDASV